MTLIYYSTPLYQKHKISEQHPESPERLKAIEAQLRQDQLWTQLQPQKPSPACRESILLAHSPSYLEMLKQKSPAEGYVALDPDTSMNPQSLDVALHATGAALNAVDYVMQNAGNKAFCAVRPPGHHAKKQNAMGFCLLNNITIAAYHALQTYSLSRVAIVDFDVHHGNGTEDIVQGDNRILFCSSFQYPFYPMTGVPPAAENICNQTLEAGSGSKEFRDIYQSIFIPKLKHYQPELLLISAGFDGHKDDPLAQLNLLEDDFYWVTQQLCTIAEKFSQGRIVSCLEGGYNLDALGRSVSAHISALLQK